MSCPFCGEDKDIKDYFGRENGMWGYVMCFKCGAQTGMYPYKNLAIEAWNGQACNLKPCPFCGSEDFESDYLNPTDRAGEVAIVCRVCGGSGGLQKSYIEAISEWNKRVKGK